MVRSLLFSSITFLYYFLPAVLVIYYLAPAKVKNLILFLASFVFYLWGSQNTVCCSFFLLQPAIWVEDASNIRGRRSVSVLLILQTDPENTRVDMTVCGRDFYGNDIGIAGIF